MSDSYRVLTRKYRPRSFDDVVSQGHIISTLRNAIDQNRISHAYLFCGPRGVGKTTMARVVARMINGVSIDIDGEELGRTLDIIEIDAASNSGVDDVRNLRDGVRVPPQNGKYKVYIIDEVHMLSKQAFNALLKTLEEPPEHVKFIFATTEPHKVLPTVLSRVQRFDFRRIKISEIVDRLKYICSEEKIKIDDASLHLIARKADGALRDALSLMDQAIAFCGDDIAYEKLLGALNAISNDRLFSLMECVLKRDTSTGMQIVHQLLHEGHDTQELLIAITEHVRNIYFSAFTKNGELLEVPEDEKKRLAQIAASFSEDDLLRIMHLTSEAQFKIKSSQQPRVLLEITILKVITMERSAGLQELLAEIQELKKKTELNGDSPIPVAKVVDKKTLAGPDVSKMASDAIATTVIAQENTTVLKTPVNQIPNTPETEASPKTKAESLNDESLYNDAQITKNKPGESGNPISKEILRESSNLVSKEKSQKSVNPMSVGLDDVFGTPSIKKSSGTKVLREIQVQSDTSSDNSPLIDESFVKSGGELINSDSSTKSTVNIEIPPHPAENDTFSVKQSHQNGAENAKNQQQLKAITENYSRWIEEVKKTCPQLVAMSLTKTKATEIRSNFVHIECQDEFVAEMIGEHAQKLSDCLEIITGEYMNIKPVIVKQNNLTASNDPYRSLKILQDELPVVKSIVDVLGAELEY
jgi:DNA polymerase-3 subunit gamma/tau